MICLHQIFKLASIVLLYHCFRSSFNFVNILSLILHFFYCILTFVPFLSIFTARDLFMLIFHTSGFFIVMYGLLTKCEVKMVGYLPSSFFACLWTETKFAKKERGQYPAILTEQTWSVKDFLYGFWWNFACGIRRVVPSGKDGSILPARVANHNARFGSSYPLAELAI